MFKPLNYIHYTLPFASADVTNVQCCFFYNKMLLASLYRENFVVCQGIFIKKNQIKEVFILPTFKEIYQPETETKQKKEQPQKAAVTEILAGHSTKDKKFSFRISDSQLKQFTLINKKMGATNSSVINSLIAKYIFENKEILKDD